MSTGAEAQILLASEEDGALILWFIFQFHLITLPVNLSCEKELLCRPLRHLLFVAKLIKDFSYVILILMIDEEKGSHSAVATDLLNWHEL